ncbi:ribosome-associated translation inhibitor RaiA [Chloroflexi bacterium TSY]|nr:ribosome-associated translation inhibitor RaiA [Chloroflexi bacterium TSY]
MKLNVNGRNVEITEWIEEYVEKKMGKLQRFLPNLDEIRAELTQSETRIADDRYTFQVTIWANRQILRAEESTGDIFASIDAAIEKISRQIERVEGRRKNRRRSSVSMNTEAAIAATAILEEAAEEEAGRIIRRKQFTLQPMNEEEALEQMELLGHDFFLFYNPDEQAVNLIYRRRDSNYGLLQPQMI